MHTHRSAEDYLEQILILLESKGYARSVDIADALEVKKPSVSIAMKKLRESGHVCMAEDGTLTLTDSGMMIASQVYQRHTAITRLFQLMGVSEETAAEDACKMEHSLSDETYRCILAFIAKAEEG